MAASPRRIARLSYSYTGPKLIEEFPACTPLLHVAITRRIKDNVKWSAGARLSIGEIIFCVS
jgi:hypothetical protein